MARTSNNFSIFAKVELDTSTIQKQLDEAKKKAKFELDDKNIKSTSKSFGELGESVKSSNSNIKDFSLSFQAANEVMSRSIDIITSMVGQVFELDDSLTELKKVSDLSGESLDKYVDKLSKMGAQVARTGKPKCLSLYVGMINQHSELL